jgi:hypothetical protein
MDKNLSKVHSLLNKHVEARKKVGFMAKNNIQELKMDAVSILQRAPRAVICGIDSVNLILPKEKIFINAFGAVEDIANFNYIPPDIYQSLESLNYLKKYSQQIRQNMRNANKSNMLNGNDMFTI